MTVCGILGYGVEVLKKAKQNCLLQCWASFTLVSWFSSSSCYQKLYGKRVAKNTTLHPTLKSTLAEFFFAPKWFFCLFTLLNVCILTGVFTLTNNTMLLGQQLWCWPSERTTIAYKVTKEESGVDYFFLNFHGKEIIFHLQIKTGFLLRVHVLVPYWEKRTSACMWVLVGVKIKKK